MAEEIVGTCTTFDLEAEAALLRDSALWRKHGHNSRTLLKLPDLRLTIVALKSGQRIRRHQTKMRLCLTAIKGHVGLTVDDETINLPEGRVLVVEPTVPHDVTALNDSVLLLSLTSAG